MTKPPDVQIPRRAVSEETELGGSTRNLLQGLNLLPKPDDLAKSDGFRTAFTGPPDSVALIEAGATAATKWWSAGLGATVVVAWGKTWQWWGTQPVGLKAAVVGGASVVTAAAVIAIAYLFASDVRGRAAASVATIEARAQVAMRMVEAAQALYDAPAAVSAIEYESLSPPIPVRNTLAEAGDEKGWLAIQQERHPDGGLKYRVVKGATSDVVEFSRLRFN